jgi:hypothetical protein
MSTLDKIEHAYAWIDAWNSRDVNRVIAMYDENVQYSTPRAAAVMGQGIGMLNGRETLRILWGAVLAEETSLRFQLDSVIADADGLAIFYIVQVKGMRYRACERQTLNEQGLVTEGEAMFGIKLA